VSVENVGRQTAGLPIEHQLDVELMVADLHELAAVGCGVGMAVAVAVRIVLRRLVMGMVVGASAADGEERYQGEKEDAEKGDRIHGVVVWLKSMPPVRVVKPVERAEVLLP
jgi:hypothetical protein